MKVDTKIVPVQVKDGWFRKKQMHRFEYRINLTEVECAILKRSGLEHFTIFDATEDWPEDTPIRYWTGHPGQPSGLSYRDYPTLIEAQAMMQHLKARLTQLKQAMDEYGDLPTEDGFEL